MLAASSSTFGESRPESLRVSFESETSWLCRRASGGAGGVFFRIDAEGDGGSGVLPADSLSNTDSLSDSWLDRVGAGGKGLLRSVKERGLELRYTGEVIEPGVGGDCTLMVAGSSRSSTFINFPCLELGGGGFFLTANMEVKSVPTTFRSSSGSDISCDVRGDSGCVSWIASKIDCRETDDVSVLLPPSPNP